MTRSLICSLILTLALPLALCADDDAICKVSPEEHFGDGIALSISADEDGLVLDKNGFGLHEYRGLFQSPIVEAPSPFDAIHFSFKAKIPNQTDVTFLVRACHDGDYSRWYEVSKEGEALFDRPATAFQYRVMMTSSSPDMSPIVDELFFVFVLRKEEPVADDELPSTPPTTLVTAPAITEREQWGARPPNGNYSSHEVEYLIVHHTYLPTAADYEGVATVKGIQDYHMDERHWTDIGYHFIIGPDGTIFRGRPELVSGAHCIPNRGKIGISLVGNYEGVEELTEENRQALVHLLAHLRTKYELTIEKILGHQDFAATKCPGVNVYTVLPEIRQEVETFGQE